MFQKRKRCTPNETVYVNIGPITPSSTSPPTTTIPMRDNMIFRLNILLKTECTGSNWCGAFTQHGMNNIYKDILQFIYHHLVIRIHESYFSSTASNGNPVLVPILYQ
eukprot:232022_1